MNEEQALQLMNRMTFERARAEAMGFRFHGMSVEISKLGFVASGSFTCVCGRTEQFRFHLHQGMPVDAGAIELDPARWLRRHGSFSRAHLLGDGYTPEQIKEIERKGEEFDDSARDALRITNPRWEAHRDMWRSA